MYTYFIHTIIKEVKIKKFRLKKFRLKNFRLKIIKNKKLEFVSKIILIENL